MDDPIDLSAALDTVIAALRTQFDTFKTVAAEDQNREQLELPAIVVQMSELEPDLDSDPHTGQFPCMVHLELRVVMGHRTPAVRREAVKAAGAIASFLHYNRLGVRWGEANILAVEPDEFSPIATQYDVWMIEWAHRTDVGDSYFVDEGVTPTQVLTSWSPDIGPDHEDDYVEQTT